MGNMVPRRLENKMETHMRTCRSRADSSFCSIVYKGQEILPTCLSIPRAEIPEHLTVDGEKTKTLTWT